MFTFKVVPESGDPFIVKAGTRDVLTWEKTTKGKTYAELLREPSLVDYYRIAHLAAWRQQLFTGNLQEFEKTHEIDLAGDREKLARIEDILEQGMAPEDALVAIREALGGDGEDEDAADEEPDPTPPGHSPEPSSPSPSGQGSARKRGQRKASEQS